MTTLIQAEILKGTRDFLPGEMAKRDYVMDLVKSVFIQFGYDTIDTPAIEYEKTLMGKYGEEGSKLIYSFEDNGGRRIALRYDQTVPFARLVAANAQVLPMPFKRYQISKVWRADKPAKGRYREFYQCDIDIIGTTNFLADAEVARVTYSVLEKLGFKNFTIQFNNRRLINSIFDSLGIEEKDYDLVLKALDKIDKVGLKTVEGELKKYFSVKIVEALMALIGLTGSNQEKLKCLEKYDLQEIESFLGACEAYGIPEKFLELNLSLARGLAYYTGVIFEAFVRDVELGAVCGGGRYDDLCSLFSKEKFSGVGVAFGFDRLVFAMESLGLLSSVKLNTEVLVTYFDEAYLKEALQIVNELRGNGLSTEVYFEPVKLGKQMKYADKKDIPFVVIYGPEEMASKEVTVKMMGTGNQKKIPRLQLANYLKGMLQPS